MKTIVVKRSKWARGGNGPSVLLVGKGNKSTMCCLGFLALQCGVDRRTIYDRGTPSELGPTAQSKCLFTPALKDSAYPWCDFVYINDSVYLSESGREAKLKVLANKSGFRFKFVD